MRATGGWDYAPVGGRLMIRWAEAHFPIQSGMQEPEGATMAKRKLARPPVWHSVC